MATRKREDPAYANVRFRHLPFMGNRLTTTTPDYKGCVVVSLLLVLSTHPPILPSLRSPSTADFFPLIVCEIPSSFFFFKFSSLFYFDLVSHQSIGYFILWLFRSLKLWRAEFEKWPFFIYFTILTNWNSICYMLCSLNPTMKHLEVYMTFIT